MSLQIAKIIGPPGTGKTTYLLRQVERACERLDSGRSILVSSLTRAAAAEFRSRLPEPDDMGFDAAPTWDVRVGTLHSHAYRVLQAPNMIGPKDIAAWNADQPKFTLPQVIFERGEPAEQQEKSDLWSTYHVHRATLVPVDDWDRDLIEFHDRFSQWKRLNDLHDFTDLIEAAIQSGREPPGNPQFIFVDEAQDHDALQWQLVRQWSAGADHLVICGDPAQNLYEWRGSEPTAMEDAAQDCTRIVLSKSYRVPEAIANVARGIYQQMSDVVHDEYQARDGDAGEVLWEPRSLMVPQDLRAIVEMVEEELRAGRSTMVLATCGYMLHPLLAKLRHEGVPFCNPYKRDNARFNPLARPPRGVGWLDKLRLIWRVSEQTHWTAKQVSQWSGLLTADPFVRGAKKILTDLAKSEPLTRLTVHDLFGKHMHEQAMMQLLDDPHDFAVQHANRTNVARIEYATAVRSRWGEEGLDCERLIVGTVHSVKGGEADTVLLGTELSTAEQRSDDENQIHRKFYVGATRARNKLVLLTRERKGAKCYAI